MKISLINMPFAPLESPSIGLTQLKSVAKQRFGELIDIQIHYLNIDFAAELSAPDFYANAISPYARMSGLSDWFFRAEAFPDTDDNMEDYLARFYFENDSQTKATVDFIRAKREETYKLLDRFIDKYNLSSAALTGFSVCFFQTTASIALARRLKTLNPQMTIVFGGPAVAGVLGKTLVNNLPSVDYIFSGPALANFPELIACCLSGDMGAVRNITGVFSKDMVTDPDPGKWHGPDIDINTEIQLDYDSFLNKYEEKLGASGMQPYLLMQTSRGCWWADIQSCSFCGLNCPHTSFEAMSPEHAIRHIQSVLKYSDRVSYFAVCDNVVPPNYFKDVFPHLNTPDGVFIKYEVRSNITTDEIQSLCNAGIRCVQPGIEALSTKSLKLMRKGVSAFSNISFLKNCVCHHLRAEWNLLLFSPGETEDIYKKYEQDIPLLAHLQPPQGVFPIEFVIDSHYFEKAAEFNLDLEPYDSLTYIYPFDSNTLAGLTYRYCDRNADTVMMNLWLDRLGTIVRDWQLKWNAEPQQRPVLVLWRDEHSAIIYDSRFGESENYRISDSTATILRALEMPLSPAIAAKKTGWTESTVKKELEFLLERKLLFEEDGKCLSLVIANEATHASQ